jgi:hypothetical protein
MHGKKTVFGTLVVAVLLVICWQGEANSSALSLDKGQYTLQAGSTVDGVAHIVASSTDAGGRLVFTINNPAVATVSPTSVTLVQGPQGFVDMRVTFTLRGIAGGGTILQVQAFSPGAQTPFIEVFANVTVTECPISLALEGEPDDESSLAILHDFRDKVMRKSPQGRQYIRQFYRHAWEGSYLVLRYPELLEQTRAVIESLLPVIEAAVDGQPTTLTATEMANIEELLDAFAAKASPQLRKAIRRLQRDLKQEDFFSLFGIDADVAR